MEIIGIIYTHYNIYKGGIGNEVDFVRVQSEKAIWNFKGIAIRGIIRFDYNDLTLNSSTRMATTATTVVSVAKREEYLI